MANEEHLKILKQGVDVWNQWREENPDIQPDLSEARLYSMSLSGVNFSRANLYEIDLTRANLRRANLHSANLHKGHFFSTDLREADLWWAILREAILVGANLSGANLYEADLWSATLYGANFSEANLSGANLSEASLRGANLSGANLFEADLKWTRLHGVDFSKANLGWADLREAQLICTNLKEANLTSCSVFGISAWGLELSGAIQTNLIITPPGEPAITVDNLEVAQFIYLLLNNEKVRSVIDTITTKVVLILGRFTPERKAILDAIRDELRKRNYLPVLLDFEKPASRDLTETVRTLAHLARFIIADITEPRSIPQELQAIVPDLAVPVQPLLLEGSTGEYGMFQDLRKYDWVLEVHRYDSLEGLLASLGDKVITPAEAKAKEWEKRRLLGG